MNAMFIRSPVRNSIRCSASSRSRKPAVIAVSAPSSMPPVASATRCEEIRVSSISSTRMTCARTRHLDVQQLLDGHAVGGLVEGRRQVVGAGDEGDALRPGPVLAGLLDAGVQVADDRPGLHDGLALELEDQPQHAVRRGVLRTHVDDDAFVVLEVRVGQQRVPVAAGDGEHPALGGVGAAGGPRLPSCSARYRVAAVLQVVGQEVLGEPRREPLLRAVAAGSGW